ncbi:MAG: hypothetical protein LBJ31_01830 [Treponema sp.]|jgi:hypothetical protein|nr:hypothetical protein [Treponema sp.]
MNKVISFLMLLCVTFTLFAEWPSVAEDIITGKADFPPELIWWIVEAQKLNPEIKIEDFKFYKDYRISGDAVETPEKILIYEEPEIIWDINPLDRHSFILEYKKHTLFNKWNFGGDTVAYYDFGATVKHGVPKDVLSFDGNRISVLLIQDLRNMRIYKIYYMPKSGICGMAWLYSNALITVEAEIKYITPNIYRSRPYMVNLILSSMYIDEGYEEKDSYNIRVTKYVYENAFTTDEYKTIKLKEFEQKAKEFEEIIGDISF